MTHHDATRPPLKPEDERIIALLVHLSPVLGLSLVAPLVVWLVFRGRGPFLEHHALETLNFHITVLIAALAAVVVAVATVGIGTPLVFVVVVAQVVLAIIAAIATNRGEWYRYPMTLRLVK